jgi:Anti-sigma-K factor rskA
LWGPQIPLPRPVVITRASVGGGPTGDHGSLDIVEASASPVPVRFDPPASHNGNHAPSNGEPSDRDQLFDPIELPEPHRLSGVTLAALAAVVGVAAIALGMWAFVSSVRAQDDPEVVRSAPIYGAAQAISLLSKRSTERIPLEGSQGSAVLAVGARGRGVLVLDGLPVAPAGRSYQAWVVDPKVRPLEHMSAAVFTGVETIVPLAQPVPEGWVVGVTVEEEGGVVAPTRQFRIGAERPVTPRG